MLFWVLLRLQCISAFKLSTPISTHKQPCSRRGKLGHCISLFAKKQKFPGTSTGKRTINDSHERAKAIAACLPHLAGAAEIELPLEKPMWACAVRLRLSEENQKLNALSTKRNSETTREMATSERHVLLSAEFNGAALQKDRLGNLPSEAWRKLNYYYERN